LKFDIYFRNFFPLAANPAIIAVFTAHYRSNFALPYWDGMMMTGA